MQRRVESEFQHVEKAVFLALKCEAVQTHRHRGSRE